MLKKRLIPCLDVLAGRTVKGVNFSGMRDAGDAISLAGAYARQGADELVFLDIGATSEKRQTVVELAAAAGRAINIPFTIGGGIREPDDIRAALWAGADKVSLNTAAVLRPSLIAECARLFGSQAVVVAIDAKKTALGYEVFINAGKTPTGMTVSEWAKTVAALGAGEILLTAIDRDGTKLGFDLALTQSVCDLVALPVIASGGVGSVDDFADLFRHTAATGALAATVFHYGEITLPDLKSKLAAQGIPVRQV